MKHKHRDRKINEMIFIRAFFCCYTLNSRHKQILRFNNRRKEKGKSKIIQNTADGWFLLSISVHFFLQAILLLRRIV